MWKRIGVVAIWILATLGTASITLAAVSRVGGEVTERPAVPVAGADLATTLDLQTLGSMVDPVGTQGAALPSTQATSSTVTPMEESSTTSTTPRATTDSSEASLPSGPTSTLATPSPTTTAPTIPPAPTSTTSTTPSTTTTAPVTQPPVTTVLVGGSVTVQQTGSSVNFISAVVASGFTIDVEKGGPSKVEVEFNSSTHESHYEASVNNGLLDIRTQEQDGGGD